MAFCQLLPIRSVYLSLSFDRPFSRGLWYREEGFRELPGSLPLSNLDVMIYHRSLSYVLFLLARLLFALFISLH